MTERWQLVELIGQTLLDQSMDTLFTEDTSEAILDSIEDLIRADEGNWRKIALDANRGYEIRWVDLRAKVEALPCAAPGDLHSCTVFRAEVLALFDGGSDGDA